MLNKKPDNTTEIVKITLKKIEEGEITKFCFAWQEPTGCKIAITSQDLKNFKTFVKNAVTDK